MPARSALDEVLELASLLGEDTRRELARHDLTETRTHLLWLLHHDGPSIQNVLATGLRVSPRHVTGLVDALVDQGLAARRPHPTDRRAALVDLTERGAALMRRMAAGYQELYDVLFGSMSAAELAEFRRLLAQVTHRLRARLAEDA